MDHIILLIFSLTVFLSIGLLLARIKHHFVYAAHICNFLLFLLVYGAIGSGIPWGKLDVGALAWAIALILLYIAVYLYISKKLINNDALIKLNRFEVATPLNQKLAIYILNIWLVYKIATILLFGDDAITPLSSVIIPYYIKIINSYFNYLVVGSLTILLFWILQKIFIDKQIRKIAVLAILWLIYLILFSTLAYEQGARRFFLLLGILSGFYTLHIFQYKIVQKQVIITGLAAIVLFLTLSEYYQSIRGSDYRRNVELHKHALIIKSEDLSGPARVGKALLALGAFYVPPKTKTMNGSALVRNAKIRQTPLAHLYALTHFRKTGYRAMGGQATMQSLRNVIPRAVLKNKHYSNIDEILHKNFPFCQSSRPEWCGDLSIGVVGQVFADYGTIAVPVIAVVLALITNFYLRLWLFWRERNNVVGLLLFGIVIYQTSYIEEVLDAILVDLRNLIPLILITAVIYFYSSKNEKIELDSPGRKLSQSEIIPKI